MSIENGNISINTENIFPIIKKWLYSEKDIFVREIVSNASDAISKMKKLVTMGEANLKEGEEYKINVYVDRKNNFLRVEDNGIGMTAEEVKKYINQIAFSGAKDFLETYKDKTDEGQIIGHFGLGFYSAFMVSDRVEIETLSYKDGEKAVKWISKDGTEYELEDSNKTTRGTAVTMYMSSDTQLKHFHKLKNLKSIDIAIFFCQISHFYLAYNIRLWYNGLKYTIWRLNYENQSNKIEKHHTIRYYQGYL